MLGRDGVRRRSCICTPSPEHGTPQTPLQPRCPANRRPVVAHAHSRPPSRHGRGAAQSAASRVAEGRSRAPVPHSSPYQIIWPPLKPKSVSRWGQTTRIIEQRNNYSNITRHLHTMFGRAPSPSQNRSRQTAQTRAQPGPSSSRNRSRGGAKSRTQPDSQHHQQTLSTALGCH